MIETPAALPVRTFIDLRRFAADTTAGQPLTCGGDDFIARRRRLFLYDGPVEVGALDLRAGQGQVPSSEADEFLFVCDGRLTMEDARGTTVLEEGQSAVLPRGTALRWHCSGDTSLVYMRCAGHPSAVATATANPEAATVQPIALDAALEASGSPATELLVGPVPACRNHTDFRSADETFTCGTWDATPYHRRAMFYPHCELMYLLEGAVTFENETGRRHTFRHHDLFVVEPGARCSWQSTVPVKKVYAIFRPKAG